MTLRAAYIKNPGSLSSMNPLDPVQYGAFPLAFYSRFWGKGKDALLNEDNELFTAQSKVPKLYFFEQYDYMEKRVDSFRKDLLDPRSSLGASIVSLASRLSVHPALVSPFGMCPGEGLIAFFKVKRVSSTTILHVNSPSRGLPSTICLESAISSTNIRSTSSRLSPLSTQDLRMSFALSMRM